MYLKNIELIGFKSFAEKTRLEFEPCMTAIVGPNGCGKSNIADALRWVLGEQSTKALRGSRMEDMIFNGTDSHKPLSMAEVSLTLAGCEEKLGTEYDEVTVTRRVLRSGEGQYFINKTPCRLKDIQRLFMDTGIGTNSYSMMEQGRIDQILSSRPEDRRSVFEEASGITKYKADKKEAIRKLEQTEANLLRLADIMREVKRRIISLQRQAGKARRYKALQDELRGLDVYLSRDKIDALNAEIATLESRLASLSEQEEALRADIQTLEKESGEIRGILARTENDLSTAMEAAVQTQTERDRNLELIRINEDRIAELRGLSDRDSKDADEARTRLDIHREKLEEHKARLSQAAENRDRAQQELDQSQERLRTLDERVKQMTDHLNRLRTESIDLESRQARLQNELSDMDSDERTSVVRRERLTAELNELRRGVEKFQDRESQTREQIVSLQSGVSESADRIRGQIEVRDRLAQEIEETGQEQQKVHEQIAARKAQAELYEEPSEQSEGLPEGARWLMSSRESLLGTLAGHVHAEPEYQIALEAALRAWLDALVVMDAATLPGILQELEEGRHGTARLLSLSVGRALHARPDRAAERAVHPDVEHATDLPGKALLDHVRCSDTVQPLAHHLLSRVRVVGNVQEIPSPVPEGVTYVTRNGAVIRPDGSAEFWMPEKNETNPMTRRHLLTRWKQELEELGHRDSDLRQRLDRLRSEKTQLDTEIEHAREALEERRRHLASREGEYQVKADEADQARGRLETVSFELNALNEQQVSSGDRRKSIQDELESVRNRQSEIRSELASRSEELKHAEQERSGCWTETTEKRVQLAEQRQAVGHLTSVRESLEARIQELESLIRERTDGLSGYQRRAEQLESAIQSARDRIQPLEAEVERHNKALIEARSRREEKSARLSEYDARLREKREALEQHRTRKSELDIRLAEERMRVQNTIERLSLDYRLTPEQLMNEPDPEWKDGQAPDRDALETQVAEIRAKLESMGPVNLVAIEEHQELEERLTFLTEQHDDLVKAKQQLLDMIRRINRTTTEMFTQTFEAVNANFQETFKTLFGGGSAKLVLVDDEDVLESGIEIIAKPPGKKLQSVSLLSGGERTMTAVALLFALYKVKPSPFCMLDELDAALDDTNIGRFIRMLKGFLTDSQFVIITHNRQTIEAADVLYGVTMEQHGVSKIVSVKFSRHGETRELAGADA